MGTSRTVAVAAMLLVGTSAVAVAAAPAPAWRPTAPTDVTGVRVQPAQVHSGRPLWSAEAQTVRAPRPARWPAAGAVTVDATGTSARAGDLPVRVGRARTDARPDPAGTSRVTVSVADRATSARAGLSGVLVTVAAADRRPARVWLELDYSGFAHALGGDYGARLRLVRLAGCSAPHRDCPQSTPVPTANDARARTLTAELDLDASAPAVLAVEPGPSSDNGDYTATDLSPAATWRVSPQTGGFSWSHPLRTPPSLGGPAAAVRLSYSSGSVDGLTSTTNNQGSWVGDGWSSWPGSIERTYGSCADDNPNHGTGDRCWFSDNATLSLDGHAGELISAGGTWRLKDDDGTRIERLTDAGRGNGDNDNEYWKVTTTDGTRYFFGYHRLPGWDQTRPVTDSTWTVPVYGDDAGEPCHAGTFAASSCAQAWRWNLDYVVDPHGNTEAFFLNGLARGRRRSFPPQRLERIRHRDRARSPTQQHRQQPSLHGGQADRRPAQRDGQGPQHCEMVHPDSPSPPPAAR